MMILCGIFAVTLLYMEIVYHLGCFGFTAGNPVLAFAFAAVLAGVESLIVGSVKGKWKKILFWLFMGGTLVFFGAQTVYYGIFKQPLLWEAIFRGGQDALTNYWREALAGIVAAIPVLLCLMLPLAGAGFGLYKTKWELPRFHGIEKLRCLLIAGIGIITAVSTLMIGHSVEAEFYEEYDQFYSPLSVAEDLGALAMAQRDTVLWVGGSLGNMWRENEETPAEKDTPEESEDVPASGETESTEVPETTEASETTEEGETPTMTEPEVPDEPFPHELTIDFDMLQQTAEQKEEQWLVEYLQQLTPTMSNEYTGIFEGYNLIYLTAEGFSTYAVNEELTPTLYRLTHSGFMFPNYYAPLWQTSTSDGEYVNCTGLIPDGQFSMRKSGDNTMAFTLPRYFEQEGVQSFAYHNNSLSYYDRYLTHPNMGYQFKGSKLGELSAEEWGDNIFPMENPKAWPASDLEMMQGTVPEYINQDRFHVYYMTVSGHMNYNFKGNAMSYKNKEAVQHLEMSENAKAYLACNIELDKALAYLLEQLEAAGKLENTVICLSADHYPYGMTEEQYEELAGRDLSENLDIFRNSLILWNAGMEQEEPVVVEKVCGSMDIIPTLLNLFGFPYDSRMYAGRDIFSEEEGLVILNDRSFITDTVINPRKKDAVWKTEPSEGRDAYLKRLKEEVKNRYQFSAYILQMDYYKDIKEAMTE